MNMKNMMDSKTCLFSTIHHVSFLLSIKLIFSFLFFWEPPETIQKMTE